MAQWLRFYLPVRLFVGWALILVIVSDLDGVNVNTLYSATKNLIHKDIIGPGLNLLGMVRILRTDPQINTYRWVQTIQILFNNNEVLYICLHEGSRGWGGIQAILKI